MPGAVAGDTAHWSLQSGSPAVYSGLIGKSFSGEELALSMRDAGSGTKVLSKIIRRAPRGFISSFPDPAYSKNTSLAPCPTQSSTA